MSSLSVQQVVEIEAAFSAVNESVRGIISGKAESRKNSLNQIFEMNNVIGRIAAAGGRRRGELRELQLSVNFTTIGVKNNDPAKMKEGLRMTSDSLLRLKLRFV